jgi:hypothetical protein
MILGRGGIRRDRVRGAARNRSQGPRGPHEKRDHPAVGAPDTSAFDDQREVIDHGRDASGFAREGDGAVALGA